MEDNVINFAQEKRNRRPTSIRERVVGKRAGSISLSEHTSVTHLPGSEVEVDDSQARIDAAVRTRLAANEFESTFPDAPDDADRFEAQMLIDDENAAWEGLSAVEKTEARRQLAELDEPEEPQAG
jgi:hypothetical protein